ncbi:MAG: PAS domain S-box protein [Anaerolineae bacterium]
MELIHPEDRERTAQAAAEALGDGPPYNVEYRIIRPNGEVRFIHSEAVVSSDESGRPRSMLGMMQDITERKLAEAALQRQVRMNNAYFTQSINCFVLFDRNFNFIRVNETFARNFGKNVEDFIGLTYPDVFPSDERYYERTHPLFDQIVRTKQPLRVFARPFTFVGQPERGETYWDWTMQPILDEKGEVEFIFFSSTDVTERKRAEDKVLYQANLLQNVSDAIIATDLDFKITSWNQAAETIYGWSAAAVIGQPAHEVLQSAFGVETWEQVMQQFLAQGFWQGETSQTRQDGSKVNVLASVSLIRDSAGRPIGAVTVNRDITERKQAETALRESEERFRLFMDNSPTIAWIQDDQSRYVYFNQTYEKRFGVQLAALRGKTIFELWPAEVAQQLWQNDQQVLAAGHLLEFTEEIPNFDGSPGTWWSLLFPFQDVSGQRYVAGIGLDITERGQMEEALYLTRFSVERAAEAIYWLDQEGHIVDVNETACRMLGYSREEMLQRSVFEVDPNITREFWQKGWQCLKDQPDKTLETIHRTRDGRLILVELGSNLVEFKGRVLSCTFARDITERKRVEAALRESEERFRLFMDNSPTIAWVKDEKGRHVYTNRTYENRYGMQLADYLGKTDFDLWPAEVAEQFRQSDQAVLAAGARMEYTEKIQNPDGSLGIWWTFKFPFQDASGQRYVAGIGLDITERQQMEEALYLTRFSVEHAADAIHWLDEQGHIVDVNETACRSLGYSREELLHLSITDIDSRHTPETWQQAWQFLKQHQTALIETTQRTKDGRLIPVEVIANYIEFEGRAFSCAFVRDITERKRAEAALRESEERFRLFMDNSPTTAWMKNEQGQYVYVNRTQENYFMASLQEWCGQTDFALWPRAVAEEFQQSDQRVLAAGHLLDFIQEIPNPDGSMDIRWVFKFPFQDVSGQRYVAGIGLDITERYRMEEALYLTRFSVEHAADAVYWLDEEGHIVDVNETACRMLGYSREEMLQFSLFDIDPGFTRNNCGKVCNF